jgi:hypothetical protein
LRSSHAYQNVVNLGGHSILSVWDPNVGGNQIFSLSQRWYVAQGPGGVQTVEVGWQVYPAMYGHTKPVLFTYWTADGYHTTGSYSNTAGDFVQVGSNPVGMALDPWSQVGGPQVELELTVMLQAGNWWIFVNGNDTNHAVGYYPATRYGNGPLATGATGVDYGGETVGNGSYPAMGSGEFASRGYKLAAYHRNIYYFPTPATALDANLVASQDWPTSYKIQVDHSQDWGESFYYGGPGGGGASPVVAGGAAAGNRAAGGRSIVVYGPLGTRVEGLSLDEVSDLLRRLSEPSRV